MDKPKFTSIETQEDLNLLINKLDWEDAFIREMYLVSPSYISKGGGFHGVYADPDIKMVIVCPEGEERGVEFRLEDVSRFKLLGGQSPLSMSGNVIFHNSNVQLYLYEAIGAEPDIIARKLHYRFLGKLAEGFDLHYGWEDFFNPSDGKRMIK